MLSNINKLHESRKKSFVINTYKTSYPVHYKDPQFQRFLTKSGNTECILIWPSAYTYELFKLRYLSDSGFRIVTFEINISKITWIDFYCCWQLGLFWPNVRAWWIRFVLTFAWLIYRVSFSVICRWFYYRTGTGQDFT